MFLHRGTYASKLDACKPILFSASYRFFWIVIRNVRQIFFIVHDFYWNIVRHFCSMWTRSLVYRFYKGKWLFSMTSSDSRNYCDMRFLREIIIENVITDWLELSKTQALQLLKARRMYKTVHPSTRQKFEFSVSTLWMDSDGLLKRKQVFIGFISENLFWQHLKKPLTDQ